MDIGSAFVDLELFEELRNGWETMRVYFRAVEVNRHPVFIVLLEEGDLDKRRVREH